MCRLPVCCEHLRCVHVGDVSNRPDVAESLQPEELVHHYEAVGVKVCFRNIFGIREEADGGQIQVGGELFTVAQCQLLTAVGSFG